ncbi:hypothetical protein ELY33_06975 [Vreelandella andesensis]|uniref:Uncharacterized protein n=1 Tax=Vreelandella andesensis TaxID=447567 RepID=A0A433KQL5_9GAMM|nr:hypothetical protein ELY33_06975 [Halomonas andesensis]
MMINSANDQAAAVELLGLESHQLVGGPVIASCGLPYHLIELADQDALDSVCISVASWAKAVAPSSADQIYLHVIEQAGKNQRKSGVYGL